MGEKFITLGIGFVVTALVARYLGPAQFGVLSYAISIVGIFASAGHMGLAGLVVREIVKNPGGSNETLGTSFFLKMLGMLIGLTLIIGYALAYEVIGSAEYWVLLIVAFSIIFQPFDIIDYWFEANIQAKYAAIARIGSVLLTSMFKLMLIYFSANLIKFAFSNIIQATFATLFFLILYKQSTGINVSNWKVNSTKARELFNQGWVIYLGSIFTIINLKIDQVMLKWLVGAEQVGIYAVAAQLSEAWYFVPVAIVASYFPKLIKLHAAQPELFNKRLQQIFDLLFAFALVVACLMTFLSEPLVIAFYGKKYAASAMILSIHIWAAIFIFMRALFSRWILIENALVFSLITQGLGALVNIIFNLILIPKYGGSGAAVATLISYAMSSYLSLLIYKKTRPIFYMMTKSILFPIRYWAIFFTKES